MKNNIEILNIALSERAFKHCYELILDTIKAHQLSCENATVSYIECIKSIAIYWNDEYEERLHIPYPLYEVQMGDDFRYYLFDEYIELQEKKKKEIDKAIHLAETTNNLYNKFFDEKEKIIADLKALFDEKWLIDEQDVLMYLDTSNLTPEQYNLYSVVYMIGCEYLVSKGFLIKLLRTEDDIIFKYSILGGEDNTVVYQKVLEPMDEKLIIEKFLNS